MAYPLRVFLLAVCTGVLLGAAGPALAAPDRLGDEVPEATPDQPGGLSFGWTYEALDLEGAFQNQRTTVNDFKLRYTINPKVAAAIHYQTDELPGGTSLVSPIFDTMDSASGYIFDLGLNLLNQPATPADPANNVPFAAGSSFGLGLRGSFFRTTADDISQNAQLLQAYLVYTTDLSEEMRAHTIFASGRLGGEGSSGSVNRIGAGLDYKLTKGRHPLVLMADGILDVYNFRKPEFNTSRVSRFNVGLRYRLSRGIYASAGWTTVNDSEHDASGSGVFLGLNYLTEPRDKPKAPCPPPAAAPAEAAPVEGAPPAQASLTPESAGPTMMAATPPPAGYLGNLDSAGEAAAPSPQPAPAPAAEPAPSTEAPAREAASVGAAEPSASAPADSNSSVDSSAAAPENRDAAGSQRDGDQPAAELLSDPAAGVAIPPFPGIEPRATAADAIMVRAGAPDGAVRAMGAPAAEEGAAPAEPVAGQSGTLDSDTGMAGDEPALDPLAQPVAGVSGAAAPVPADKLRLPLSELMALAFSSALETAPASAFVRPPAASTAAPAKGQQPAAAG